MSSSVSTTATSSSAAADQRGYREGYRPLTDADWVKIHEYEAKMGHPIQEVEDKCAGCVVFTRDPSTNELLVLLIENFGNWYSFPKGHLEKGEDDISGAIRETHEEVGILVTRDQIVPNSQNDVKYSFFCKLHNDHWVEHPDYPNKEKRPMVITHKRVAHFSAMIPYPMEDEKKPVAQLTEVKGVGFYKIDEALRLLGPVIAPQLERHLETLKLE